MNGVALTLGRVVTDVDADRDSGCVDVLAIDVVVGEDAICEGQVALGPNLLLVSAEELFLLLCGQHGVLLRG